MAATPEITAGGGLQPPPPMIYGSQSITQIQGQEKQVNIIIDLSRKPPEPIWEVDGNILLCFVCFLMISNGFWLFLMVSDGVIMVF